MRFSKRTATGVAACAVIAAVGPTAGLATPPEPVVIQLDLHFTSPTTTTGTFTMAGVVEDQGIATQALRFADSTVHGVQTMTSSAGTITIRFQAGITPTGPTTRDTAGNWVIVRGTGAYATLHGRGHGAGEIDLAAGTLDLTYSGTAHAEP
jgi:hypothetical protein